MLFPELAALTDAALLLLRLLIAAIFASSGWAHITKPEERAKSIGMSPRFTAGLGAIELTAAASVALGIFAQVGAAVLIAVMAGAIYRKIIVWKTGFWGDKGQGWFYDLLYLACNLVILTTGGGAYTLV